MAIITQDIEIEQQFSSRIRRFFKRYQIGALLQKCNAYKCTGIPVVSIVMYLFCLVFRNRSMYLDMTSDRKTCDFKQDTVYRLKNAAHINWLRFTTLLSARIIKETIQPLTSEDRGMSSSLMIPSLSAAAPERWSCWHGSLTMPGIARCVAFRC